MSDSSMNTAAGYLSLANSLMGESIMAAGGADALCGRAVEGNVAPEAAIAVALTSLAKSHAAQVALGLAAAVGAQEQSQN